LPMRESFNQELETLRQDLLRMGQVVSDGIRDAVQSLARQDVELARKVIEGDDTVDKMEMDIEDKCMVLIARQQPLARDLRIIGTDRKSVV
jgi:phosphate transport system protein